MERVGHAVLRLEPIEDRVEPPDRFTCIDPSLGSRPVGDRLGNNAQVFGPGRAGSQEPECDARRDDLGPAREPAVASKRLDGPEGLEKGVLGEVLRVTTGAKDAKEGAMDRHAEEAEHGPLGFPISARAPASELELLVDLGGVLGHGHVSGVPDPVATVARNGQHAGILAFVALASMGALVPIEAQAQEPMRVVVVDPEGSLGAALDTALTPWGISVQVVAGESPGATMPGSEERGRALAQLHVAHASVWISESADGFAVWIYDARQDRIIARELPSGPPFDELTAAEVALTVKSLLRQGPVRPASDDGRSDAAPRPPATPEPTEEVGERPVVREWSLMTAIGARLAATSPDRAEARFALGLSFWPEALGEHLGFALVASLGPGFGITTPDLSAHWTETAVMFALRGRLPLAEELDIGLALGAGANLTTLDGTLTRTGRGASVLRVNPLLSADLTVGLRLDARLRLELRGGSAFPMRMQTYLVGEAVGLVVEPVHARIFLSIEVALL